MHFYKKLLQYLIAFAASAVFLLSGANAFAVTATYEITGYGWGGEDGTNPALGGIGWISFSSKTPVSATLYGVYLSTDDVSPGYANFSGYAWSGGSATAAPGGIGWISFNPLDITGVTGTNCPSQAPAVPNGSPCAPRVAVTKDPVTGRITGGGAGSGFARACAVFQPGTPCHDVGGNLLPASKTGGWDGWISLRTPLSAVQFTVSPTFGLTPASYMWGGSGVAGESSIGWVGKLDGLTFTEVIPPPSVTFDINRSGIYVGETTFVTWRTIPPSLPGTVTSCTGTGGDPSWAGAKDPSSGPHSQTVGPFTSPAMYTYFISCDGPGGNSGNRSVQLTVNPLPPEDGVCGTAKNVPSRTEPNSNLCSGGTPSVVTKDTGTDPDLWRWTCFGINGSTVDDFCSVEVKSGFQFIEF